MSSLVNLSICLSDIPAEARRKAKNGKVYTSITVQRLKNVDSDGNTHSVSVKQTKEERERKDPRVYLGRGKEIVFAQASSPNVEDVENMPVAEAIDDLPF